MERTPLGERRSFAGGLQRVADGVYAWIQPNGGLGESNAGLVVGERESVLIDTLWDEHLTRRMLAEMAPAREGAPIRTVFNTHGDGDHWYGNGLLRGTRIVATGRAAGQMAEEPPAMLTRMAPLPRLAGALGSLPVPGRARLRGIADFGVAIDAYDFRGLNPRLPSQTFSKSLSLEAGGRRIELHEVGPAHTVGDAIAWVEDAGVVFSGDIVFSGVTPVIWAGPASNWIVALERIEALEPDVVVPGHGPVCDLDQVAELRAYWEWLIERVSASDGLDPDRLTRELLGSEEFARAPWSRWRNPERNLANVAMIAREQRNGATGPVNTPKRISLLSAIGALRRDMNGAATAVPDRTQAEAGR